MRNKMRLC